MGVIISMFATAEGQRLVKSSEREADWKNWGPYVSDRAWGTVREDYSEDGSAWEYFDFWQAHKRAFRWNEDGIGGVCNRMQNICLGVSLWNEKDPILKERLFGVSGSQGNHGEDVKEYYYYLDSTPTHSYMKMLYKYPHNEYPYEELAQVNGTRDKTSPEYELFDALKDDFTNNKYFDVFIEYAKADEEDILCRITAINRSNDTPAPIHILPHIWYRNDWSWGYGTHEKPVLKEENGHIKTTHRHLGDRFWYVNIPDKAPDCVSEPELLFTENESNFNSLWGVPNTSHFVKDGINATVVDRAKFAVNPKKQGSKAAAHMRFVVQPSASVIVETRFCKEELTSPFVDFSSIFQQRLKEADEFYSEVQAFALTEDERSVQRQAFAGIMWSKQFYHYAVELWKNGDPAFPAPPESRKQGRNRDWNHLYNLDVISMPDKWEYPWYAAWDLAFHTIPIAMIDPEWAKRQLILMMREWYMHPNGQIPAYEWAFGDVNPPVHAWACLRVYEITKQNGEGDIGFLEKVFHKLLLNFTWWVNRKDASGNNVFQGGFLGLDNIGIFDRSQPLPEGFRLDQADGTAWMGMFALNMLSIALEIAQVHPSYEDVATKFFEHFVYIANAINAPCNEGGLWNESDGFYYDSLHYPDGSRFPLKMQTFVGLIPLYAVTTIHPSVLKKLPNFRKRTEWFTKYRPHLMERMTFMCKPGDDGRLLLSLVTRDKLVRVAARMFDHEQFLSDYGLRSMSKRYENHPFTLDEMGKTFQVSYQPAESSTYLFGGNSNWRGPIWFPTNYLMIESLAKFHCYFGDDFTVEFPTGSGSFITLKEASLKLSGRMSSLFLQNEQGIRPFNGDNEVFQNDPNWKDHILFYEYFHGDNGRGVGASHQTGWTALVARLLHDIGQH